MFPRSVAVIVSIATMATMATMALAGSVAAGASGALSKAAGGGPADGTYAVGVVTQAFVDKSRPTAANGDCKKIPSRTLPTTIFYPATGDASSDTPQPDAAPDSQGGPYPLVAFAHGFGGNPQFYAPLLEHWAANGFVVAAVQFPLSSSASPCGAVAGDSVNQPEDVSFVISSVLKEAVRSRGTLAGLVDRHEVGAAGHSNGGITTYGLIANTKLRDPRVKAAAVLAGTLQRYPDGRYDFTKAPPVLLVHGTEDIEVPYELGVDAFNRARGPKGLLTIDGGDHGSAAGVSSSGAAPQVRQATTDFFNAYLRGDSAAKRRIPDDQLPAVTTMKFVAEPGSTATIPTLPTPKLHLKATATPTKNLTDGQLVTVTWSGYSAGKVINILECNGGDRELQNGAACDYTHAYLLKPNPTGAGSTQLPVVVGQVGDGICDAKHPGCFIVVNNASSSDPKMSVMIDISFAK